MVEPSVRRIDFRLRELDGCGRIACGRRGWLLDASGA